MRENTNNNMALTLAESLCEARNLPAFNGTYDYTLSNYLRDVTTVLGLTSAEHKNTIRSVLSNRLQGKALLAVETLMDPTWEAIIQKLKEEFGVKRGFFNLRSDALNVDARNIELNYKLSNILCLMNTKYILEPNILYTPDNNEKLIFDIYINYLPISIKTLLIQNNIRSIGNAYSFFLENNLLKDIKLNNIRNSFQTQDNIVKSDNLNNRQYVNSNGNFRGNFKYQNRFDNSNHFGNTHNGGGPRFNLGQNQGSLNRNFNNQEPMEVEALDATGNFHFRPRNYHYQ